jgi:glutamate synthase (NADPH/NADH) small chain
LAYLTASNKLGLGDDASMIQGGTIEGSALDDGSLNAAGKNVVVIGGGDTAMDCVRTAIRQGARSVKCLYRRDRQNMPGSQREVRHAEEEGVDFVWQAAPEAFLEGGAGRIGAVRAHRIHLGLPDAGGRQTPRVIEKSHFNLEADLVIKALGFDPEDLQTLFDVPQLSISKAGTLRIDPKTMMTNVPQVFAAGDIVRGASLVVWAIRDGRDAAAAIHQHLAASRQAVKAAE